MGVAQWARCRGRCRWWVLSGEAEVCLVFALIRHFFLDDSGILVVLPLIGDQVTQRSKASRPIDRNGMC